MSEIKRTLRLLFRPEDVVELRVPKAGVKATVSGYYSFDAIGALTTAAAKLDGSAPGIYVTLNHVNPALLARSSNRVKEKATTTTADTDILLRRWLPLDIDPARPSGISATAEEHEAAIAMACAIMQALVGEGWPEPILADSGNGAYLLYRLPDLPNNGESTDLVKKCLQAINSRFKTDQVSVDLTVYNAARIVKLFGTVARKGDHTLDRPHRLSRILKAPEFPAPVPVDCLRRVAESVQSASPEHPASQANTSSESFDLAGWMTRHGLNAGDPGPWKDGAQKWVLKCCPFNPEHTGTSAVIIRFSTGALAFNCKHNSCAGKGWRELRELLDGRDDIHQADPGSTTVRPNGSGAGSIITRCVADIEAKPVCWLWRDRIARGKVSIIAGNPGLGKSQVTASIAGVVTTGGCWPVDRSRCEFGDVMFLSAEDDAADTLRPRLEAAGANLRRVHVLDAVVQGYTGEGRQGNRSFSLQQDLAALSAKLNELGDVAVVVIDPITAYLGDVDSHRNAEVRALLAELSNLAAQHNTAIIGVSHLNKTAGNEALMRVTGSLAFVAAARAAYLVAPDPDNPARRFFLPMKNNIGPDSTGMAFHIESATVDSPAGPLATSRVMWEPEPVTTTADEIMQTTAVERGSALHKAEEWLKETLAVPVPVSEVESMAKDAGIKLKTLRRASDSLKVVKEKTGMKGGWMWSLPPKMPKCPEDAQQKDMGTFGTDGHLRENEQMMMELEI